MNCVIPGQNLKVMGKAVHALAKIGDELYLEANEDDMVISTVNMAKTSYAVVKLFSTFFTHYAIEPRETSNVNSNETLKCKIPMKAILGVFKSHNQLEKQVEICKLELEHNPTKITFKFRYKHDVSKTQSLWLLDGESLQVSFKQTSVNQMSSSSSLYSQALANFQLHDDEVSFDVNTEKLVMRNFIEGETSKSSHVRSQLTLNPSEFDFYKIGKDVCITFALRPFKAAIQFAENFNLSLSIDFQTAGKPLIIIISKVTFEANFILATLNKDGESQSTMETESIASKDVIKDIQIDAVAANKHVLQNSNYDPDMEDDSEIIEQLCIPDSPELSPTPKRMKTVFKRCFEATYRPNQLQPDEIILAENSDPEFDF